MIIETLLREALATRLGLMSEAGFKDEVGGLNERFTQDADAAYHESFDQAWGAARVRLDNEILTPLLSHPPFQEAVVAALLDPVQSFDVSSAAGALGERYAEAVRPLRRFFATLAGELEDDAHWGTLLEQYQKLSLRDETKQALQAGAGAIAQDHGVAAGAHGAAVGRDVGGHVIIADHGATVHMVEVPITMTAVERESALGRYLSHLLSRNRYLQLQGIRSGVRLVNIELERIYVTLKASRTRTAAAETAWLAEEQRLMPGDTRTGGLTSHTETVTVKVEEALAAHPRLVVLGDPGSGKTTLLRYLALCYARDRAEAGSTIVRDRFGLPESGRLPILLPLRNLGAYLKANHAVDDGIEGHGRLLRFLCDYLRGERIDVPETFFDGDLEGGNAVLLFDGMDEVGDFDLRRRVARLIEDMSRVYYKCRMVVTSRIVGYAGAACLAEEFATTTVRDFTLDDVRQFLSHWHYLVAVGQMGPVEPAGHTAAAQTEHLMTSITSNPRVRELAINPLMLTVIALVHRDQEELPERRAELYAEAVDVLLGKWDVARGVEEHHLFDKFTFDAGDRRLLLQTLALRMQEQGQREIEADELRAHLLTAFAKMTVDERMAKQAVEGFLTVVQERTGLLVEAGQGVYRFSHLTFQEYLAAVEMAEGDHDVADILSHMADPTWREVVLLAAGHLSSKSRIKTTRLIQAIAASTVESEPFHNLVLAGECLRDAGPARVDSEVAVMITQQLRNELNQPIPQRPMGWAEFLGRWTGAADRRKALLRRRVAAATALSRIESGHFGSAQTYWSWPYGEPEWVAIPAGEFWMGSDQEADSIGASARPAHRLFLPAYQISRTPITNAQYQIYVDAAHVKVPGHWTDGQPPKDKMNHPVVYVSWQEACGYCEWLSHQTGQRIHLPTEAQWERAARGDRDQRVYPWGDSFDEMNCNHAALEIEDTTPVGIFLAGASPGGCLDMLGNVWEWTLSLQKEYPYLPVDGREDLQSTGEEPRVLRGGAFDLNPQYVRCAVRLGGGARLADHYLGFRVVVSSLP